VAVEEVEDTSGMIQRRRKTTWWIQRLRTVRSLDQQWWLVS